MTLNCQFQKCFNVSAIFSISLEAFLSSVFGYLPSSVIFMFTQVFMYHGEKYHPAVIIFCSGLPYLSNSLPWSPQCLRLPSSLPHYKSKLHWWNDRWRYHKSIKTWNPYSWSPKCVWKYFGKLIKNFINHLFLSLSKIITGNHPFLTKGPYAHFFGGPDVINELSDEKPGKHTLLLYLASILFNLTIFGKDIRLLVNLGVK